VSTDFQQQDVVLLIIGSRNEVEEDAKVVADAAGSRAAQLPFELVTCQSRGEGVLLEEPQDILEVLL
jgi:hypothetical protein